MPAGRRRRSGLTQTHGTRRWTARVGARTGSVTTSARWTTLPLAGETARMTRTGSKGKRTNASRRAWGSGRRRSRKAYPHLWGSGTRRGNSIGRTRPYNTSRHSSQTWWVQETVLHYEADRIAKQKCKQCYPHSCITISTPSQKKKIKPLRTLRMFDEIQKL